MSPVVTSAANQHLKLVRRLASRRGREQEGLVVVEGEDLVIAAMRAGVEAHVVLVASPDPDVVGHRAERIGLDLVVEPEQALVEVRPDLLAAVSQLGHPPRLIGVFETPDEAALATVMAASAPVIYADAIGDPGNIGTLLRSVAALGAGGVLLGPGTADPWGPKALRAAMGATFRVPFARCSPGQLAAACEPDRILALDAGADTALRNAGLDSQTILVVGAERAGVSADLRALATRQARIPQAPGEDSLNAAVAAAVALYEWRRAVPPV